MIKYCIKKSNELDIKGMHSLSDLWIIASPLHNFIKTSSKDEQPLLKQIRRQFGTNPDSIRDLCLKDNDYYYVYGVRLGPIIKKVLESLEQLAKKYNMFSKPKKREFDGFLVHLRDTDIFVEVARVTSPKLFKLMHQILSSRPLTTERKRTEEHITIPKWVDKQLEKGKKRRIHFDTGYAGSIPQWMVMERGMPKTPMQFVVSLSPENQLDLDYNLNDFDVIEDIENGMPHIFDKIDYCLKNLGKYSKNIKSFYAVVFGAIDYIQDKVPEEIKENIEEKNTDEDLTNQLIDAIELNDIQSAKKAILYGANINWNNGLLLSMSAIRMADEIFKMLMESNINYKLYIQDVLICFLKNNKYNMIDYTIQKIQNVEITQELMKSMFINNKSEIYKKMRNSGMHVLNACDKIISLINYVSYYGDGISVETIEVFLKDLISLIKVTEMKYCVNHIIDYYRKTDNNNILNMLSLFIKEIKEYDFINIDRNILIEALESNNKKIIDECIKNGLDINSITFHSFIESDCKIKILELLKDYNYDFYKNKILEKAFTYDISIVPKLLSLGLKINSNYNNEMLQFIIRRYIQTPNVLELFLQAGGKINKQILSEIEDKYTFPIPPVVLNYIGKNHE
jgi:hypothetical protein